jgi:hypothetical protein
METPLKTAITSHCLGKNKVLYGGTEHEMTFEHSTAAPKRRNIEFQHHVNCSLQLGGQVFGPPVDFGDFPLQPTRALVLPNLANFVEARGQLVAPSLIILIR